MRSRRSFLWALATTGVGTLAGAALYTRPAAARASFDSRYTFEQTFNAALRLVRVDRGYKVTEKDQAAGYVLFEYQSHEGGDRTSTGSVEMVPAGSVVKVMVQLAQMPRYHEQVLANAIEKKLKDEYGEPPPRKPDAKPPEGAGGGGAGGASGSGG